MKQHHQLPIIILSFFASSGISWTPLRASRTTHRPSLSAKQVSFEPTHSQRREIVGLLTTTVLLRIQPGSSLAAPPTSQDDLPSALSSTGTIEEAASLVNFGRVEEGKGQWEKATRYYTKAIQTAPDFAPGYLNRANVDVVFGRLEEALAGYNSAIRVSSRPGASYDGLPDRWLYYLNRGTTRLALNREPQKSVDDFDKAAVLRQRPEVLIAQNRAQAYERLGKYNLALGDYSNAVALRSRDVQPFWLRYAAVLYQNERDASALEVLRRVKSSFSGEAEVNAALAAVLAGIGNQEAALEAYRSLPALQRQKYADPEFLQKVVRWPPRLQEAALTLRKMDAERAGNLQKASGVDWGSGASSK